MAVAEALRWLRRENLSSRCFDSGLAVSIFRDQSTRTRFSFFKAANLLGLGVQDLDEGRSQIAHGETVRETANMIAFFTEFIGIRDDIFLGAGHTYMQEVSAALQDGFDQGVLEQRPNVINLQSDIDHPTQSMADLMHLKNHFGSLEKLRGKKLAMTWAYSPSYGKPLSVPQGIIGLMPRLGMDVVLAYPEGYHLIPDTVKLAGKLATEGGGSFKVVHSMEAAFDKADVVYPKSWAPYAVMEKRTELLKKNDTPGLKELEKACLAKNAEFKSWECTEAKMKLDPGRQGALHALPAGGHLGGFVRGRRGGGRRLRPLPHPHLRAGRLQAVRDRRGHADHPLRGPAEGAARAQGARVTTAGGIGNRCGIRDIRLPVHPFARERRSAFTGRRVHGPTSFSLFQP